MRESKSHSNGFHVSQRLEAFMWLQDGVGVAADAKR